MGDAVSVCLTLIEVAVRAQRQLRISGSAESARSKKGRKVTWVTQVRQGWQCEHRRCELPVHETVFQPNSAAAMDYEIEGRRLLRTNFHWRLAVYTPCKYLPSLFADTPRRARGGPNRQVDRGPPGVLMTDDVNTKRTGFRSFIGPNALKLRLRAGTFRLSRLN